MNSNVYKQKIITRRVNKLQGTNDELQYVRVFYASSGRLIVRLYFKPSAQLTRVQVKRWCKWLLADKHRYEYEKGLTKLTFYCGVENFWWKFIKCSFC